MTQPKTGIEDVDEAIEAYQDAANDLARARARLAEAQAAVARDLHIFVEAGKRLKIAIDDAALLPIGLGQEGK